MADAGGQHEHVLHRPGQADADDDPDQPRQIAELHRQHRPDQRPGAGNGREMMAEQHPFVRRMIVLPVVEQHGRRRPRIVEHRHLRRQKRAVIAIRDRQAGQHEQNQRHRGHEQGSGVRWRSGISEPSGVSRRRKRLQTACVSRSACGPMSDAMNQDCKLTITNPPRSQQVESRSGTIDADSQRPYNRQFAYLRLRRWSSRFSVSRQPMPWTPTTTSDPRPLTHGKARHHRQRSRRLDRRDLRGSRRTPAARLRGSVYE